MCQLGILPGVNGNSCVVAFVAIKTLDTFLIDQILEVIGRQVGVSFHRDPDVRVPGELRHLRQFLRYRADPARRYETNKSWRNDNPEKIRASSQRRRAAVVAALSPDRDEAKIAAMHSLAVRLTEKFGTPYHVDHLVPLSKGGMHHESNLVVMRADYNCSKGAKIIPPMIAFFGGDE